MDSIVIWFFSNIKRNKLKQQNIKLTLIRYIIRFFFKSKIRNGLDWKKFIPYKEDPFYEALKRSFIESVPFFSSRQLLFKLLSLYSLESALVPTSGKLRTDTLSPNHNLLVWLRFITQRKTRKGLSLEVLLVFIVTARRYSFMVFFLLLLTKIWRITRLP